MARATSVTPKSVGRPPSGRSITAKATAAKLRLAPKAAAGGAASSKEELRARVEKLERANATLRVKNKELRMVAVQAAEQVDALTLQLASSERRAVRLGRHEAPAEAVATREITRPSRGSGRKGRAAAEHAADAESALAETVSDWTSPDHADA